MPYTTAADLAAGQIAMVGEARYRLEHQAVWTNLVTRMTLGEGEKSLYIPKFGRVTASDLSDGIDMTEAQQMTITGTTHTTDEAGCKVVITRKLRNQLKEDGYRAAGKVIGNAMAYKIDTDGLALFSGLDDGLGSAGTSYTQDYFLSAVTRLHGKSEPAPEPIVACMHPYHFHEMGPDAIGSPGTNNMPSEIQAEVLLNYYRGNEKLYGIPIFIDGNIAIDSSDDAYSAVFSKSAFIYLVGWEPDTWVEEDKSLRGWEIGIVADYGVVEEDGAYGYYLYFDATAPTS